MATVLFTLSLAITLITYIAIKSPRYTYGFQTRTYKFPFLNGLKILAVSDLHIRKDPGPHQKKLYDEMMKFLKSLPNADLCVLIGDVADYPDAVEETKNWIEELRKKSSEIIMVLGNHDIKRYNLLRVFYPLLSKWDHEKYTLDTIIERFRNMGVRVLNNEWFELKNGVWIYGVNPETPAIPSKKPPNARAVIVLSHHPDYIKYFLKTGFKPDLFISGHTHGGQVVFFKKIRPVKRTKLPSKYSYGLNNYAGINLLVTSGLGASFVCPVRFGTKPEAVILTGESQKKS